MSFSLWCLLLSLLIVAVLVIVVKHGTSYVDLKFVVFVALGFKFVVCSLLFDAYVVLLAFAVLAIAVKHMVSATWIKKVVCFALGFKVVVRSLCFVGLFIFAVLTGYVDQDFVIFWCPSCSLWAM